MAGMSVSEFYGRALRKSPPRPNDPPGILGDATASGLTADPSTTAVDSARGDDGNAYPKGLAFGVDPEELLAMPRELVSAIRSALEGIETAMKTGLPDDAAMATQAMVAVHERVQSWRATNAIKAAHAGKRFDIDGLAKRAGVTGV